MIEDSGFREGLGYRECGEEVTKLGFMDRSIRFSHGARCGSSRFDDDTVKLGWYTLVVVKEMMADLNGISDGSVISDINLLSVLRPRVQ